MFIVLLSLLPFSSPSSPSGAQLPPGHGKPLGQHNNLGTPAPEEDYTSITPASFYERYVATRTPVILRGLAKTFPAYSLWTDQYITDNYGDLEVRLEAKTEKETHIPVGDAGQGRSTFQEFFRRYKSDNMYCVSEVPSPMYTDLQLPGLMNCGSMKDSLVEINLWVNSGGAKSIIHKDAHNQLNCLLAGAKDWIFIDNKHNDGIYQAEEIDGDQGGYSLVNPDQVNYKTFPKFADVPWEYATVQGGDCLYLPPRYYHQVKSTDRNFAVSFLFGTRSQFEMGSCDVPTDPVPLEGVYVQWRYPGHGLMSMGNSSPGQLKTSVIEDFAELLEEEGLSWVTMDYFLNNFLLHFWEEMPYVRDQFERLISEEAIFGETETVTIPYLESLPDHAWRNLTAAFSFDPSNDPNVEYWYISQEDAIGVLQDVTYYSDIDRDTFIGTYCDKLGGSARVGRELFAALSKDGEVVTWYDIANSKEVFAVFGRDHDRGDGDMQDRNEMVKAQAEVQMRESGMGKRGALKDEL